MLIQTPNPQTGKASWYLDRWSIVFLLLLLAVVVFFISRKASAILFVIGGVFMFFTARSGARILSIENPLIGGGAYCYKPENGAAQPLPLTTPQYQKLTIDGIKLPGNNMVYKTANGTDVTINGTQIHPAGFGSAFINALDNAGYKPQTYFTQQQDTTWNSLFNCN